MTTPAAPTRSRSRRSRLLALAIAALVLLLAILWYVLQRPREQLAGAPSTATPPANATSPREVAQAGRAAVESLALPIAEPAAEVEADVRPAFDAKERAWITLRFVDEQHRPVAGAVVTHMWSICSRQWASHTHEVETAPRQSASDGRLRLAYRVYFDRDCQVDQLSVAVHHPDFAPLESYGMPLAGEIELVLVRGETLVLSGWIGSVDNVINDLEAQFSDEIDLDDGDWFPRRDGRRTTTRIPRGRHLVRLRHWTPQGVWWSDVAAFEVAAGVSTEVHLELHPAVRLAGRLGDEVPRPVVDGRVSIVFTRANAENPASSGLLLCYPRTIEPDGSFEIAFLHPDQATLIAICRGWASRGLPSPSDAHAGAGDSATESEGLQPQVDLRTLEGEFVVPMEPTATLEVRALDPFGAPVPGVSVSAWPNVSLDDIGSIMFANDFSWSAVTDQSGVARVDSIPPGRHGYSLTHAQYQLALVDDDRSRRVRFSSGELVRQTLAMEPIGGR